MCLWGVHFIVCSNVLFLFSIIVNRTTLDKRSKNKQPLD